MPIACVSDADVREAAMGICQERCAFMGEPACWKIKDDRDGTPLPWPSPLCDDPGCMALAQAALAAIVVEPHLGVIAQLRHAYMQLAAGTVRNQKQFADGLIAPQIVELERFVGRTDSSLSNTEQKNG